MHLDKKKTGKHNIHRVAFKCEECDRESLIRPERVDFLRSKNQGRKICKFCLSNKIKKELRRHNPFAKPIGDTKLPNYTVTCQYCQKEFIVLFRHRDRIFCSKKCQASKGRESSIKKTSLCKVCQNEFEHYGAQYTCGEVCMAQYISSQRLGENNPAWKKDKYITTKCLNCQQDFIYKRGGLRKGQARVFCKRKCNNEYQRGRSKDELGFSGYQGLKGKYAGFHEEVKKTIRERDQNTCRVCGKEGEEGKDKLPIHHIDYDDTNQNRENLVTLCGICHNLTRFNKYFWETLLTTLNSGSKIVKKGWGLEVHVVNHNEYCFKFLLFWEGKRFSFHYHNKKEIFLCLTGRFECHLEKEGKIEKFLIKKGDKIEIEPNVLHQVIAINNSILVEVSTRDYPEDSKRIIKGD